MDGAALSLIVMGAVLHAVWNLFAKKASGGLPFVWLYGLVSLVGIWPLCLLLEPMALPSFSGLAWCAIVGSAVVHLLYMLTLQKGYQESDFSLVYPLARGTGPLFSVIGAVVLLGETPSWLGGVGLAGILLGIALMSNSQPSLTGHTRRLRAGLVWGTLTGLSISAYTVLDGWAMMHLGLPPVLYYVLGLSLRSVMLAPLALRDRQALRAQWDLHKRYVLLVGLISPLAYLFVLFAMERAPLSYVAPLRELSMLVGLLFGATLLKEAVTPSRLLGTALMMGGVLAITLA
jgi:drug/metabolite transporter (DMT)-like permease